MKRAISAVTLLTLLLLGVAYIQHAKREQEKQKKISSEHRFISIFHPSITVRVIREAM